ncbi:MAG TPA: SusC/RagA family TonB-linked outer membrane protein, partial [Chitinophagaceae bacterium]
MAWFIMFFAMPWSYSFGQQATVTGKVTGEADKPLSGVSVQVKGTNRGTTTKAEGIYSISASNSDVLVFSYVGYEQQEIAVANKTEINVSLLAAKTNLEQVVVIGYGTASKRDLTGSISKVAGKEVADKPNTNPLASVQGKVAGVSVVNSGQVGQEPDIRIRGTISRTQTKPLYVVDGIFNDNIDFVNPADIESMEVLKDPSSLAIFGVRGANGVIIITTKKGRTGQVQVNLTSTFGFKTIVDKIKLTDAPEFKTLYDEQRANQGAAPYANYGLYQGNSDWIDLISQDGFITNNNISISGGTDKNKFYMGVGYIREDGVIKNESLKKYLLTVNDEFKVSKGLKFGFDFSGIRSQLPELPGGSRNYGGAVTATPIVEPFNDQYGVYNRLPDEIGGPQIGNPLMSVEVPKGTDLAYEYRAVGNVFGEVDFLRHFNFRASFYGDFDFNTERLYTPIIYTYAADFNEVSAQSGNTLTKVYQKQNRYFKLQQEYLLTYKNKFGDHNLTAMAGFTTNFNDYTETNGQVTQAATGDSIPFNERFWYLDNFFGDPSTKITAISSGKDVFGNNEPLEWEQATVSYLVRALYNYKGKYMLNASFRRDGSSDISPDNRFQNFVAVGVAWELTKENFMQKQNFFDFLKLKASWGILGNQYTQIHYPFYPLLASDQVAIFGNSVFPGYSPSFIADSALKWETVDSKEVGVEFRILKNRLSVEGSYYNKITDDLLTSFPGLSGQKPGITNAGKIENKGIEISVSWADKLGKDFSYTVSGNITTLHNEVKELYQEGFEIIDGPSRTTAGYPIGYFYG